MQQHEQLKLNKKTLSIIYLFLDMVPEYWPYHQKRTSKKELPSLHKDLFFAKWKTFYATCWLSKLKRKWWSNSIPVACNCINWRLWRHLIYNPKWYGLPWLQHGGCIVCFKQSQRDPRHCGQNTSTWPFIEKSISKDLKGPKKDPGNLQTKVVISWWGLSWSTSDSVFTLK